MYTRLIHSVLAQPDGAQVDEVLADGSAVTEDSPVLLGCEEVGLGVSDQVLLHSCLKNPEALLNLNHLLVHLPELHHEEFSLSYTFDCT